MDNAPYILAICVISFAVLSALSWMFIVGVTQEETPKPKGFDNGNL